MKNDDLATDIPDLSKRPLSELRYDEDLSKVIDTVLHQVERPRANLGSSGPPGRAD